MKPIIFIKSAGWLFCFTALAKLSTLFSHKLILELHDPILGIRFRTEFWVAGLLELVLAVACLFFPRRLNHKWLLAAIAAMGTAFAIYRLGFSTVGLDLPCPCLGSLAEVLHLSSTTANLITLLMLIYLVGGSYYYLLLAKSRD